MNRLQGQAAFENSELPITLTLTPVREKNLLTAIFFILSALILIATLSIVLLIRWYCESHGRRPARTNNFLIFPDWLQPFQATDLYQYAFYTRHSVVMRASQVLDVTDLCQ